MARLEATAAALLRQLSAEPTHDKQTSSKLDSQRTAKQSNCEVRAKQQKRIDTCSTAYSQRRSYGFTRSETGLNSQRHCTQVLCRQLQAAELC